MSYSTHTSSRGKLNAYTNVCSFSILIIALYYSDLMIQSTKSLSKNFHCQYQTLLIGVVVGIFNNLIAIDSHQTPPIVRPIFVDTPE